MIVPYRILLPMFAVLVTAASLNAQTSNKQQLAADQQLLQQHKIPAVPADLGKFFGRFSSTNVDEKQIKKCISRLGHRSFRLRQKATQELLGIGPKALRQLQKALESVDLETHIRAKDCITKIKAQLQPEVHAAAARVLAHLDREQACRVLFHYLPYAVDKSVSETVQGVLLEIGIHKGNIEPLLVKGLRDPRPTRRALSALVVAKSGSPAQRQRVYALLEDADVRVRFQAAHGLLLVKDQKGLPVLLDVLRKGPYALAERTENIFLALAQDAAPEVTLAKDKKTREDTSEQWHKWWNAKPAKLAWAELKGTLPGSNYTGNIGKVAAQFAGIMFNGEKGNIGELVDAPFYYVVRTFPTKAEVERYLSRFGQRNRNRGYKIRVGTVTPVKKYLTKATPRTRTMLQKHVSSMTYVVRVEIQMPNRPVATTSPLAILVQRRQGRARVIGIFPDR